MNDDEYLLEETSKLIFSVVTMIFYLLIVFVMIDLIISFNLSNLVQGILFVSMYVMFLQFKFNIFHLKNKS